MSNVLDAAPTRANSMPVISECRTKCDGLPKNKSAAGSGNSQPDAVRALAATARWPLGARKTEGSLLVNVSS
jgi:hypothetical protein